MHLLFNASKSTLCIIIPIVVSANNGVQSGYYNAHRWTLRQLKTTPIKGILLLANSTDKRPGLLSVFASNVKQCKNVFRILRWVEFRLQTWVYVLTMIEAIENNTHQRDTVAC